MNTTSHYTLINKQDIEKIKSKFFQKKSNRIILHTKSSIQQEMIIAQKKNYYFPVKKNIQSDQTFTILYGRLLIIIFDNKNNIIEKFILSKKKNFICRIKKNVYHCDIALSKVSVHLETKSGVFSNKTNKLLKFPNSNLVIKKILKAIR
jgi:cupin fold WbuC family metalloprotein